MVNKKAIEFVIKMSFAYSESIFQWTVKTRFQEIEKVTGQCWKERIAIYKVKQSKK